MQCRCEAENERHCEGYRCYDQYTRKRDIGHHKSILCVVCCLDVGSDMSVHLDEHLDGTFLLGQKKKAQQGNDPNQIHD